MAPANGRLAYFVGRKIMPAESLGRGVVRCASLRSQNQKFRFRNVDRLKPMSYTVRELECEQRGHILARFHSPATLLSFAVLLFFLVKLVFSSDDCRAQLRFRVCFK